MTPELRAERDRVYGPCNGKCGDKYCAEYHAEKARQAKREERRSEFMKSLKQVDFGEQLTVPSSIDVDARINELAEGVR